MQPEINEYIIGSRKNDFLYKILGGLLLLIFSPLLIFSYIKRILNKSESNLNNSLWEYWETLNNIRISRKMIEVIPTGHGRGINIYELKAFDNTLNLKLKDRVFTDFILKTNKGTFLREIPEWKKKYKIFNLVYIENDTSNILVLKTVKSHSDTWKTQMISENEYEIMIDSEDDNYKKMLNIKI